LGKVGVVFYTLLSLAGLAGLALAEINGLLVTPYASGTSYVSIVYIGLPFTSTAGLIYVIIDNLTSSLKQARQNAQELAASNTALEEMRASLEDQVAERTASAEAARQEAESARQVAEAQAWQTAGLVQLGDAMRGEQDLLTLASQVVQHLCHYLDARVGTLFVVQDEALHLAGAYACTPGRARFEPGQGLIGQAMRDGQPIVVGEVPAGYLPVASGLGDTPPRQIAIWPLFYEGQPLGAIELGLLDELSAAQRQFLDRAAEGVAMALHTAQSRAQIHTLLAETQTQARELALREEELQAINEELQAQAESLRASEPAEER
jgi:transcriptional regulator with GAF, ATPase, and Fis domain